MRRPPARQGGLPAHGSGRAQPVLLLTLVVGGLLSLALHVLATTLSSEQRDRAVERAGRTRATALRIALEEDLEALVALRSLWSASEQVTREEFRAFVQPLLRRHSAIQALEWVPAVAADQVDGFIATVRAEGFEDFALHGLKAGAPTQGLAPGGVRYPVLFVEPWVGNESVHGLDLGSEALRRRALMSAASTGSVCASEPVELHQAPGSLGLILALPVFAAGARSPQSNAASTPRGFVVSVLEIERAVRAALAPLVPEEVHLRVAIDSAGREVFALDLPSAPTVSVGPPAAATGSDEELRLVDQFEFAGLDWRILAGAEPGFGAGRAGLYGWLLLAAGLSLTASLAVLLGLRERRARELEHANVELERVNREREEALTALRVSEERFRLLFERHGSMMFLVDHESGTIVDANAAAEDFYGYSRERLSGMRVTDLDMLPADEVRRMLDRAGRETREGFVVPHRLASGEVRTVEIHSSPIEYMGRRLIFVILHDVSDREALQLRRLESQKLESLGVLAGGIAHDFNNLLTSVIGHAELAQLQLPRESDARNHIEATLHASQRAAELTRRLLAYAGQGSYERQPMDLGEQVREAMDLVGPSIPSALTVELDLAQGLPAIEGDRLQMQQVVVNLVLNAVESLEQRAGSVSVRTSLSRRPSRGVVPFSAAGAARSGPHVLLEVQDDGPGMDAATQARIFDPFFSTKFAGRGLGLASVLGIVRAHGGQLSVESQPDVGTRFLVWLPALSAQRTEPAEPARNGRVLVVDDEPAVRDVTAGMLSVQGFEVDTVASGEAALELCAAAAGGYDLAILDVTMPGIGGLETLRRLRECAPHLAVLMSSGYGEAEAAGRLGPDAPEGFLQKPFSASTLVEKVRAALAASGKPPAGESAG